MAKIDKSKKIEEKILKIAIEIAKSGEGAMFVIGKRPQYSRLLKQKFDNFSVFSKGADKVLRSLAVIDGAVIVDSKGMVIDYGTMIKNVKKAFTGYGTRHAAGLFASKNGNTVILCSEEERKVKIFKDGKYVMQIDALEKNVEKSVGKVSGILESIGAGLIGTIGTAALAPSLGIALIPGVLVFGGSYYAIRSLLGLRK